MNIKLIVLMSLAIMLFGCGKRNPEHVGLLNMKSYEMFPTDHNLRALALAASNGDIAKIDRLVAGGVDVNAVDTKGYTAAFWVLFNQNKEGFKRLLEHGTNPNTILHSTFWNKDIETSLIHEASNVSIYHGEEWFDYLEMILTIGNGNPNLELPRSGSRPIEYVVRAGHEPLFALLYNAGAEINYKAKYTSLLTHTVRVENFELAYFLLTHGVDYSTPGKRGLQIYDALEISVKFTHQGEKGMPQYMWFWRCIDILEKRGMTFDFLPEEERPTKLDTNPPAILSLINKR